MPRNKAEAGSAKAAPSFNPKKLTQEQLELCVEEYFGVHPRYLVYEGLAAKVDVYRMQYDGKSFSGLKPHLREIGEL